MDSRNYTDVLIDGKIYTLAGSEEESYLQRVASYINEQIIKLKKQEGFTRQSLDYQTVMVELNLADDFFKAQNQVGALEQMKAEADKEIYSLKHELITTQMKLENALKEIEDGKKKLEEKTQEIKKLKSEAESKKISSAQANDKK